MLRLMTQMMDSKQMTVRVTTAKILLGESLTEDTLMLETVDEGNLSRKTVTGTKLLLNLMM